MRHLKSGRKLGRNSSHRKAMFRNMTVPRSPWAGARHLRRAEGPAI